jgi:hypothetical protein
MKKNVGGFDRWFRIVGGVVVIAAGIYFKGWWGLVGLIPLFTGLFAFCPLYLPFKFSTLKKK